LEIPVINQGIKKSTVAVIVVLCDVLVCITFLIALYVLEWFEKIDSNEINKSTLKIEDFTVVIRNLPKKS
jgi:arginine exporter protein ArgO